MVCGAIKFIRALERVVRELTKPHGDPASSPCFRQRVIIRTKIMLSLLLSSFVTTTMSSSETPPSKEVKAESSHLEYAEQAPSIAYHDSELEPRLHWRTYVALASMCILQFVLLSALLGPPSAVSHFLTFITAFDMQARNQTDKTIVTAYNHRYGSKRRQPQKLGHQRNDSVSGRPRSYPRQRLRYLPVPEDNSRRIDHTGNDRLCRCSRIQGYLSLDRGADIGWTGSCCCSFGLHGAQRDNA